MTELHGRFVPARGARHLVAALGVDDDDFVGAACKGVDAALFDPAEADERYRRYPARAVIAARYCRDCPVRVVCGIRADAQLARGVWGGSWRSGEHRAYRVVPLPFDTRKAG